MGKTSFIIDTDGLIEEISSYLFFNGLVDIPIQFRNMFKMDLTDCIIGEVQVELNTRLNLLIRHLYHQSASVAWVKLGEKYNIDTSNLTNVIVALHSYNRVRDFINYNIPDHTFDIWMVSKIDYRFAIEYVGDYRILEWSRDHIKNGRYT